MQIVLVCVLLSLVSGLGATVVQPNDRLQEYFNKKIERFKVDLHRSFEEARVKRKRNDGNWWTVNDHKGLQEKQLRVEGAVDVNVNYPIKSVRTWTAISSGHSKDQALLFWGQNDGRLALGQFQTTAAGTRAVVLASHLEPNAVPLKSKHYHYDGHHWLLVGYKNREGREYIVIYQVNRLSSSESLLRRQTIETDIGFDLDIAPVGGRIYLAVSSYLRRTTNGTTFQSMVKLYEWRHTQFDFIAEQRTHGATSVKLFVISGSLYLAVAQAVNEHRPFEMVSHPNDFRMGSPVFVYNSRETERLNYVQLIRTSTQKKVEHFVVEGSTYLIFFGSSTEDARIFWWAGDQFLEVQILQDTKFAVSLGIQRLPNNEMLLALVFKDKIKFFTESTDSHYKLTKEIVVPGANFDKIEMFTQLPSPTALPNYYVLLTFWPEPSSVKSNIWKLNLKVYDTSESLEHNPLFVCLHNLEQKLTQREEQVQKYITIRDRVWVTNKPQKIVAPVIIKGAVRTNDLNAQNIVISNSSSSKLPPVTSKNVKAKLDTLNNFVNSVRKNLAGVVLRSVNQTITGPITFVQPVRSNVSFLGQIYNPNLMINKIPLADLAERSLTIDGHQTVTGQITFENVTADNLQIAGPLNNLNLNDVLYLKSHFLQEVSGTHRYGDVVIQSNLLLNPRGTINGIRLDQFVLANTANQQISGRKTFLRINLQKDIHVNGMTNGRDLSLFSQRAVLLDAPPQVINGRLTMTAPIRVDRMTIAGLINRVVNISQLAHHAVNIYGHQDITGKNTFLQPVYVNGILNVNGLINGINLNDVVTINNEQVLTGEFVFKAPVTFQQNLNFHLINGINLNAEAVKLNTPEPQYVNGTKIFKDSLNVLGDISMNLGSTIDGVDPSDLRNLMVGKMNSLFEGALTFENLIVHGNVQGPSFNRYLIRDLPKTLWLKSVEQTIPHPVRFHGTTRVQNLFVDRLNLMRIPEDFVLRNSPFDLITGNKSFVNLVDVKNNVEVKEGKMINGIDLSSYHANFVSKFYNGTSDNIYGIKSFKSLTVLGNVIAGSVNGLDLSRDVMLANRTQIVNADIKFNSSLIVENGFEAIGDVNIGGTINNVSLPHFYNEIVRTGPYPGTLRPIRNKIFASGIQAQKMTAFGLINLVDIDAMKNRVVRLDVHQDILGRKNFTGKVVFQNDFRCNLLNGLDINKHVSKVVMKNQHSSVNGLKTLSGTIIVNKNLEIGGLLNGLDLGLLRKNAMSKTRGNFVSVPMNFLGNLTVKQLNVDPLATVDGKRLADLVYLNENTRFGGKIQLNRGAQVNGDIVVKKLINNCDLRKLRAEAVLLDNSNSLQVLAGVKKFKNFEVIGDVIANGPVNGMNLNELAAKIVTKQGNQQQVEAPLEFADEVLVGDLIINNIVNGQNLSFVFNDAVLKSRNEVISGNKIFRNHLDVNGSRFGSEGPVFVGGLVNGVDIKKLDASAAKRNQKNVFTGVKTFTGSVRINKNMRTQLINGIKIPDDLVLLNTSEVIPGRTTFKNVVVFQGNLQVNQLIDGVNLTNFFRNRVTLTDPNEVILSQLNLTGPATIESLTVKHTINGIPIRDFVTRQGNFTINGVKSFGSLSVAGNLVTLGRYNEIDLQDLTNRVVSLKKPEVISGITEFVGPVEMTHMKIEGKLNGVDISDLANFFKSITQQVSNSLDHLKTSLSVQEDLVKSLFATHLKQYSTGISYFMLIQEIVETSHRITPISTLNLTTPDNKLFSVVTKQRFLNTELCNPIVNFEPIFVYQFHERLKTFKHVQNIDLFGVNSMVTFQVSGETFLAVASGYLESTFILQYRGFNFFEVVQSITTPGVEQLRVYWTNGHLDLAVAAPQLKLTKILRAVVKGTSIKKFRSMEEVLRNKL